MCQQLHMHSCVHAYHAGTASLSAAALPPQPCWPPTHSGQRPLGTTATDGACVTPRRDPLALLHRILSEETKLKLFLKVGAAWLGATADRKAVPTRS